MIYDNTGRWIDGAELIAFKQLPLHERLKWVREELNKIYVGEYSVKKVALNSGVISHMGLYNLERNEGGIPRQAKLIGLTEYYQVPMPIFSAHEPDHFFLGKQYDDELLNQKISDIRAAHYEVEITFTMRNPDIKTIIDEKVQLNVRHLDGEELLIRIKQEVEIIRKRIGRQNQMDEAYDILTRRANQDD